MYIDANLERETRFYYNVFLNGIKEEDCFIAYVGGGDEVLEGRGYVIRVITDIRGKCVPSINMDMPEFKDRGFDYEGCLAEVVMGTVRIEIETAAHESMYDLLGIGYNSAQQTTLTQP